jgi:hypothetical protein
MNAEFICRMSSRGHWARLCFTSSGHVKRQKEIWYFLFQHNVQHLSYVHPTDLGKHIRKGELLLLGVLMSRGENFRVSRGRSEETEWRLFWLLSRVASPIKN